MFSSFLSGEEGKAWAKIVGVVTKVGVASKFSCMLCAQIIKHPPLLNPGYTTGLQCSIGATLAHRMPDVSKQPIGYVSRIR